MRFTVLLPLVALAACSQGGGEAAEAPATIPGAEVIDCALGGSADFGPDCVVERAETDGIRQLVVRHPDGGFRRFDITDDGSGLVTSDGADPVQAELDGSTLAVEVGPDRYRFPATVQDDGAGE